MRYNEELTKSKKIFVFGITTVVFAGVIAGLYTTHSTNGVCYSLSDKSDAPVVSYFSETLENGFIEKKGGRPIEGFQPFMFMEAYLGLGAPDFNCVEEYDGGVYIFKDKQLILLDKNATWESSAEGAITLKGMNRLLQNIADRLGRPFPRTNAEVDDIIYTLI